MFKRIWSLGVVLTAAIFLCDVFLPSFYHFEFVYSVVILLTIWIPGRRSTFDAAIVLVGLIISGFFLNNDSFEKNEIASILIPSVCLWAFAFAIIKFKAEEDKHIVTNERLNAMFENATEGIIISNQKGEIVMANPHSEKLFGFEKNELVGNRIESLVPNRFAPTHAGHRKHYYTNPQNRPMGRDNLTLFAKRKDGVEFPVEISLSSFKIKDERFVISFIIDITERKKQEAMVKKANEELEQRVELRTKELAKANLVLKQEVQSRTQVEEALRDSERLFTTIGHNFPNGMIIVLDRSFNRIFIDGKEFQELDMQKDDFIGPSGGTGIFLASRDAREKLQRVFEWENVTFDVNFLRRVYEINAVPLPDIKGFIKEILLVIQNVTDVRQANSEMKEALEKERQLNELKSRFVSTASHEFRTPLSTILSSSSLAEKYIKPEDAEKRTKHFERIKSSVKNLTEILNDFLSLEKLEAGKVECKPSQFDIVHFAEDIKEEMQTLAKAGQHIHYEHVGQSTEVNLDKQLLRNICINLINNAIKYSPEDKAIDFITEITPELSTTRIKLTVKDYGIGIPLADQQHLFETFFRAKNVTAIQGTGLGLNIVNRYTTLMDGKIQFHSNENEGSEFTVVFIN